MNDIVLLSPYAWLFIGALYWKTTLALITALAVAGAVMDCRQTRMLCFGTALLLSADVLLLFLLPNPR